MKRLLCLLAALAALLPRGHAAEPRRGNLGQAAAWR